MFVRQVFALAILGLSQRGISGLRIRCGAAEATACVTGAQTVGQGITLCATGKAIADRIANAKAALPELHDIQTKWYNCERRTFRKLNISSGTLQNLSPMDKASGQVTTLMDFLQEMKGNGGDGEWDHNVDPALDHAEPLRGLIRLVDRIITNKLSQFDKESESGYVDNCVLGANFVSSVRKVVTTAYGLGEGEVAFDGGESE